MWNGGIDMEYPSAKIKKNGKVVGTNDSMWQTKRKRKVGPDLDSMAVPTAKIKKEYIQNADTKANTNTAVDNEDDIAKLYEETDMKNPEAKAYFYQCLYKKNIIFSEDLNEALEDIIRSIVLKDLKNNHGVKLDIEALSYLEDRIFNKVRSIGSYGFVSNNFSTSISDVFKEIIMEQITSELEYMEYHLSYESIDVINRVLAYYDYNRK